MGLDCFMMKTNPIKLILIIVFLHLMISCQPTANKSNTVDAEQEEMPTINEDELILGLSSLMTADTSLAGREQNSLVNYAIDHLYDVQLMPSGLLYEIIQKGEGTPIVWGDFLSAHYKGSFLNGKIFADSHKQGKTLDFYVGNMIDAWNEGLQLINVGGKIRLLVPSNLGYGKDGLKTRKGKILVAGDEPLIFEVAVLEKKERSEN